MGEIKYIKVGEKNMYFEEDVENVKHHQKLGMWIIELTSGETIFTNFPILIHWKKGKEKYPIGFKVH